MQFDSAGITPATLFFVTVLFALLIAISVADIRYGIIPDWMNAAIAGTGLLRAFADKGPSLLEAALAALLAFCSFALLRCAFAYLRGYSGMGMGDVKFMTAAATWTGLMGLPSVILVASVSGLFLVVVRNVAGYPISQMSRLPFGPHLAVALATVCLFGSID
jgi:leader peptidase (prepilin peptidase)/N-methyltransferase